MTPNRTLVLPNRFADEQPPRKLIVVGISDFKVSSDPDAAIVTYALGSCIAMVLFDPVARLGGLLHIILPESKLNPVKAAVNPFMFADTGIPKAFDRLIEQGANWKRLTVYLAGGAQVMDPQGIFNIGKRNHAMVRKLLWKAGVMVTDEAVGGEVSRTVRLELNSGKCYVREGGREDTEVALKGGF